MKDIPSYMEKHYNIQRQLGAGSYGTVFLGVRKGTNEQYLHTNAYHVELQSSTCIMCSIVMKML